jgi:hypothetical protein
MDKEQNLSSVIKFDDEYFFNKAAILEIGLSREDAEAVYEYLLYQNKEYYGSNGYVFINAFLQVRYDRPTFVKHGLWCDTGFSKLRFFDGLKSFLFSIFGSYLRSEFKFTGFFEIDREINYGKLDFHPLRSTGYSYVNNHKVSTEFRCLICEDFLIFEPQTCVRLPERIGNADRSTIERVFEELYFTDEDVSNAIQTQLGDYDFSTLSIGQPKVYSDGFKCASKIPIKTTDEQAEEAKDLDITQKGSSKNSDINLADSTIIAALTHALELENREKFTGNDKIIFNHLATLFPEQKRFLAANTIKKRLAIGRSELGISKKERKEQ